jgi:hypothetical protein
MRNENKTGDDVREPNQLTAAGDQPTKQDVQGLTKTIWQLIDLMKVMIEASGNLELAIRDLVALMQPAQPLPPPKPRSPLPGQV